MSRPPPPVQKADPFMWFIAILLGVVSLLSMFTGAYQAHHASGRSVVLPPESIRGIAT
jgi:hypothetical protein